MPDDTPNRPPIHRDALHAPWRDRYMKQLSSDLQSKRDAARQGIDNAPADTFLGQYWANPEQDDRNHVIARVDQNEPGEVGGMILLNRYPYANGHLLVALGCARERLTDYTPAQRAALWALVDRAVELVETALCPQGVNIGVNQGRAAGAGVPMHLHTHVVPRWLGDVNFIDTVANIRVIPSALDVMAQRYREAWARLNG
ncbi:MAG: HIT domain-containing protein [Phycisphaeraceae bacterium]|nr:HIT domain-containing protein [Phycisphaeraceae bacterium]